MAWHSGKPADNDFLSVSVQHIRENFAELEPLQPHVAELVDLTALQPHVAELVELTALQPHVAALLDSRIVEMGSTSNGEYVRWENGLQVCWLYGSVGSAPLNIQPEGTGTFRWVYPAQFSIVPIVFGSPNQTVSTGGGRLAVIGTSPDISTVSADGYRYNTDADRNVDGPLSLLAIGRWK